MRAAGAATRQHNQHPGRSPRIRAIKTTGMNVQVACTIYGKLAWISDPVNGSRHDHYCQEQSGVLLAMNPKSWIGDKGRVIQGQPNGNNRTNGGAPT
jgi:hypothetical protein